jgi:hypothetical protein
MATSPLFGWEEPDDTDLVKDGAAAIRTLGNAIDTSMGDLLGGTTGQVLSKNSNSNMDFTWVTSDDANAIQNAIVNAKGDIIGASANDTPAITSVGANGTVLTASSGAATGLAWSVPAFNLVYSGSFSGATTHTFDGVFTSDYDNYKVIVFLEAVASANTDIGFGLRQSGVGSINYDSSNFQKQYNTTVTSNSNAASLAGFASSSYTNLTSFVADVLNPENNTNTMCMLQGHSIDSSGQPHRFTTSMYKFNATRYFGCTVTSTSGNIGGQIRIYGYKD